jgi:transcriptional regulator with XRE-family HTH domain
MITGRQIRAARALLDMSQDALANAIGLTAQAVRKIESGDSRPREGTMADIVRVFAERGVEFIERGARLIDKDIRVIEGDDAYAQLLDDIYYDTRDGSEVLWFCADDTSTRPGEIEAEERIRTSGVHFRCLIDEKNNFMRWPPEEYRKIPSTYYNHDLQVIYKNKVAQLVESGKKIMVISNASLAQTERNKFNYIWDSLTQKK